MPHLFLTLQKDRNILAWQGQMQEFSIRGGVHYCDNFDANFTLKKVKFCQNK